MESRINTYQNKKQLNRGAANVLTSHDRMRDQLAKDVEDFLAQGGEIQHLESYMHSALSDSDQDIF
ncbi:hypothetical protein IMCC21906_00183 [Spongiibacter sp. IMCC21906]|uniref:hypothetical protein n=1 Tax=Spongiibacter sp. IMCC21906 TaxID=1620392 RepID=UPI00062DFC3E|nr:hypothetical protein [Spongiibacter sp. IMCC21906]AKH67877.1 hypothetical protein IMCC21906_00183 [Spongiibacter sp. IMCC21906]